ncbi:hypothetical protein DPMN_176326 [Dreissena polymorpha]|uniref:Uncharacterized protein n=1 Tax=Dreissena polymorpha TaxID=45954 RepID=A0A9D4EB24_DREPO|nr:hypothetical protein DPMN_176326 [Dreissena polymorpha]
MSCIVIPALYVFKIIFLQVPGCYCFYGQEGIPVLCLCEALVDDVEVRATYSESVFGGNDVSTTETPQRIVWNIMNLLHDL